MPQLKLKRKLGPPWTFELVWRARSTSPNTPGPRQQLGAWTTQKAFWRSLTSDTVIVTDTGGFASNETADPDTFGDFTYTRTDQALLPVGTYRLDFEATIGGVVVPAPEDAYVIVEVLA